jgi:hypothetical protein
MLDFYVFDQDPVDDSTAYGHAQNQPLYPGPYDSIGTHTTDMARFLDEFEQAYEAMPSTNTSSIYQNLAENKKRTKRSGHP